MKTTKEIIANFDKDRIKGIQRLGREWEIIVKLLAELSINVNEQKLEWDRIPIKSYVKDILKTERRGKE